MVDPRPVIGTDSRPRCSWGIEPPDYVEYHDLEWGRPPESDHQFFETVCLEGFQAGLSWMTILRKRPRFRQVFAGFEPSFVSALRDSDVQRLMGDRGIIRNEKKIRSAINNAQRAIELIDEFGSLSNYFGGFAESNPPPKEIPAKTETSARLARDLRKRGWTFVGPTTMYAFMQSTGLVNDHIAGCWVRDTVEALRRNSYPIATGSEKPS